MQKGDSVINFLDSLGDALFGYHAENELMLSLPGKTYHKLINDLYSLGSSGVQTETLNGDEITFIIYAGFKIYLKQL